jgi:hypothetical protein
MPELGTNGEKKPVRLTKVKFASQKCGWFENIPGLFEE